MSIREFYSNDTSKLSKSWDELVKEMKKNSQELTSVFQQIKNIYSQNSNDYKAFLANAQKQNQESSELMKYLRGNSTYDDYISSVRYSKKMQEIDNSDLSNEDKYAAKFYSRSQRYEELKENLDGGLLGDTMEQSSEIFADSLQDMILGYKDFSDVMKNIGTELSQFLLSQMTETFMQMVFTKENFTAAMTGAKTVLGFIGKGVKIGANFIGNLFKHHSGGVIPSGANYSLPGTEEQLALLKGGERVLSPSENVSYESAAQSASPVVFNNFNIKAWDSKDVRKYLLENRQLLNQITFQGIKDNNSQLRTMVRNA